METWPGEELRLRASDSVIADKVCKVNADMERSNREATAGQFKHVWTCKEAVGPRWGPAACGQLPTGPSESTLRRIVPNGFLLPTCPVSTYANQIVSDEEKVCTRSHQTFMNVTKRGSGSTPGLNRGASR
jgi:hypothetical protein